MKEIYEVIDSRICDVQLIDQPCYTTNLDLSIVSKNSKYGLMYNALEERNAELIVPCEYDNIYFTELWLNTYCIAILNGKSGLFKLLSCQKEDIVTAIAEQIVPCIYERIENCYPYHLLYDRKTVQWYNHDTGKISAKYDRVVPIGDQYLLYTLGNRTSIWDHLNSKFVFNIPENCQIAELGYHDKYAVFKLFHTEDKTEQLLFCCIDSGKIRLSHKAENIIVYFKHGDVQDIIGIQMSWGNMNETLNENIIDMIT